MRNRWAVSYYQILACKIQDYPKIDRFFRIPLHGEISSMEEEERYWSSRLAERELVMLAIGNKSEIDQIEKDMETVDYVLEQ